MWMGKEQLLTAAANIIWNFFEFNLKIQVEQLMNYHSFIKDIANTAFSVSKCDAAS